MDLQNLSLAELRQLQAEVENTIKSRQQEEVRKAREEILSIAGRVGLPVDALLNGVTKGRKSSGPVAVKYRHPDEAEKEWTGRGRQPKWIKDFIDAGGSMDQLEVK